MYSYSYIVRYIVDIWQAYYDHCYDMALISLNNPP